MNIDPRPMDGITHLDLDHLRADTPGVAHRVDLNNAGAGLMPDPSWRRFTAICGVKPRSAATRPPTKPSAPRRVYDSVARLVGAGRDEIALMENATVAWQMAFYGWP